MAKCCPWACFIKENCREKRSSFKNIWLLFNSVNADFLAALAEALKLNLAVNEGEEGIVRTLANAVARMNVGSALSYKDVACKDELTVRSLSAESLGFRITAVLCGTHTFFMSEQLDVYFKHYSAPLSILM